MAHTYGLDIEPQRPVHTLSVGERQRVEIVRALLTDPQLLILDEPTSVLTPQAVDKLFVTLRRLAERGCSILYISHKLDEIRALCHHCTVLRGGKVTGEVDPTQESNASLSRLMIGAEPPQLQHKASQAGADGAGGARPEPAAAGPVRRRPRRTSPSRCAPARSSAWPASRATASRSCWRRCRARTARAAPGSIKLFGKPIGDYSPRQRRKGGLHFVPEERLGRGAVPTLSAGAEHAADAHRGGVAQRLGRTRQVAELAEHIIDRFHVKAGGPGAAAKSLSGGNLQKFIVGREIDAAAEAADRRQPTWGVDVGAAALIRGELLALRDAGCALLVVSEELDELFEISDRLVVIAQGRMSPSVPTAEATIETHRRMDERPVDRPRGTAQRGAHAQA